MSSFLLSFGFAFANILQNVRLRGNTMVTVLPEMKARKNTGSSTNKTQPGTLTDSQGETRPN